MVGSFLPWLCGRVCAGCGPAQAPHLIVTIGYRCAPPPCGAAPAPGNTAAPPAPLNKRHGADRTAAAPGPRPSPPPAGTGTKTVNEKDTYNITYQMGIIKIEAMIENETNKNGVITQKDFVNAGNKDATCNTTAEVEVYKDSDFVYCYKVHKDSLGCLTKEYKSTIKGDYAIDTCEWK